MYQINLSAAREQAKKEESVREGGCMVSSNLFHGGKAGTVPGLHSMYKLHSSGKSCLQSAKKKTLFKSEAASRLKILKAWRKPADTPNAHCCSAVWFDGSVTVLSVLIFAFSDSPSFQMAPRAAEYERQTWWGKGCIGDLKTHGWCSSVADAQDCCRYFSVSCRAWNVNMCCLSLNRRFLRDVFELQHTPLGFKPSWNTCFSIVRLSFGHPWQRTLWLFHHEQREQQHWHASGEHDI